MSRFSFPKPRANSTKLIGVTQEPGQSQSELVNSNCIYGVLKSATKQKLEDEIAFSSFLNSASKPKTILDNSW